MKYQLYLDKMKREYYKSTVQSFRDIFIRKLYPAFKNIEQDAGAFTEEYYNKLGELPGDDTYDMSYAAEIAQDKGVSYYMELRLVKYEFTAISIVSLYHLWEQQLRKFLFDEISHNKNIDLTTFCDDGYNKIVDILQQFSIDIESFTSFPLLTELRLLSNTVKHGDGRSARKLKEMKPELFRKPGLDIPVELSLDSTLLEENLVISDNDFSRYSDTICKWWDEFPERSFCDNLRL